MKKSICLLLSIVMVFSVFTITSFAAPEEHIVKSILADTYVQAGDGADVNYGSDKMLIFKASTTSSVDRKVYLKFDISDMTTENISNVKINLYRIGGEDLNSGIPVRAFSVKDFEENEVTFNSKLLMKKVVGVGYANEMRGWFTIDITEYAKEEIAKGSNYINICLYDRLQVNKRVDISSREGDNPPYLDFKYGGTKDPIEPLDDGLGGSGSTVESAIENAKKLVAKSNAVYKDETIAKDEITKISDDEYLVCSNADSHIRGGEYENTKYGKNTYLRIKQPNSTDPGQVLYTRSAYFKFDISPLNGGTVGGAFLKLCPTSLQGGENVHLNLYDVTDTNWDENSISWSNAPVLAALVKNVILPKDSEYTYIDLTDYINEKAAQGKKYVSFCLKDDNRLNKTFDISSKEGEFPPYLMLQKVGGTPNTVPLPQDQNTEIDDGYDYITVDVVKSSTPSANYVPTKTRIVESLTDFTPLEKNEYPEVSIYGGLLSEQYEATGFFRTEEINGRWWMIDPLGHPLFNFGFNTVSMAKSEKEKAGLERRYGTVKNWANSVSQLFDEMNVHGVTYSDDVKDLMDKKVPYFSTLRCIGPYGNQRGMVTYSGSTVFKDGVMPVFDPQFEKYIDKTIAAATERANDPYLLGWFSDNEISVSENMLIGYLTQDPENEDYIHCYYTAWEWLKARYGEDASIDDITAKDKDDWREFVFDRYYSLVSQTLKKYDQNHMYLGSRLNGAARTCEGVFKAAGRYLDAISFNYYGTWTPRDTDMDNWYKWSGKPFIVTECYTKGMDASERIPGLNNLSGAGWVVKTQEDRGNFYQNYSLALIESKTCIGFQWYKYQDNDPDYEGADPSNVDANKGILDRDFNDYPELIEKMTELNQNVFELAKYFDAKNVSEDVKCMEYEMEISNNSDTAKQGFMILALYKNGTDELVNVSIGDKIKIGAGNKLNARCKLTNIPDDYSSEKYYIKAFVWDNFTMINPIISSQIMK